MARLPRLVVPNQPHHIIQRSHDHLAAFRDEADFQAFLNFLREAARLFRVAVHAYVLMPDQIHVLATPQDETGLARLMQWVGRQYVPYFNTRYSRSGALWQGRYRATVIEAETYFLSCCRFIELKPVHSGIVVSPSEYRWSSFGHHAGLKPDPVITDHPTFWALGNTPFDREAAYRQSLEQGLSEVEMEFIGGATMKGWPLGSDSFRAALSKKTGRRVTPAQRGRPAKHRDDVPGKSG